MMKLKEQICHKEELRHLSHENKDCIFDHVYNYTMRKLYPQFVPI
jgi:hypothetical protein